MSASDAVDAARAAQRRGAVSQAELSALLSAAIRLYASLSRRALRRRGPGRPDVTPTEACTVASALLHSQSLTPFEFSVWFATAGR